MDESEYIQIGSLQHFSYCIRQCALMYTEGVWAESKETKAGDLLHKKTHEQRIRYEKGVRIETGTVVVSHAYALMGVCDTLEFEAGVVRPIEYKVGKTKRHLEDKIQLCAQVLCLEEMLGKQIAVGYLYYKKEERRVQVAMDEALRQATVAIIEQVRALLASGVLPVVAATKKCPSCSLLELCAPNRLGLSDEEYWQRVLSAGEA